MITYVNPVGTMALLSQTEVDHLRSAMSGALYRLYRNCSLAVLKTGSHTDSSTELLSAHLDFEINLIRRERGVKIELINAPKSAQVDYKIAKGIQEHLFAVLRDIVYLNTYITPQNDYLFKRNNIDEVNPINPRDHDQNHRPNNDKITNDIFCLLRNAQALRPGIGPNLIVCWGGHSINEIEFKYAEAVGYQLGLRDLNVCTGSGPGVMDAAMRGASVGHSLQRNLSGRFLGLTEPSIIAAEPPNAVVNELVIMPDIEKRLEAFVRLAHGLIIFPGGPGTAEELLYILGIMMHPANKDQILPIILTGPKESKAYFETLDQFIHDTLGLEATKLYTIVIDDPEQVAVLLKIEMERVKEQRLAQSDAYTFSWSLHIESDFQHPFEPTHENMASLDLSLDHDKAKLAANLRRAFSCIVAGNVKDEGIQAVEKYGPFILYGSSELFEMLNTLLTNFIKQQRMKLPGTDYIPSYKIVKK